MTANKISDVRRPAGSCAKGFTLVELLVVIGIIALLIGILLPSLATARQASQRVACAAKLHQIMIAASSHVVEHQGYYPVAGQLNGDGGQCTPSGLNDAYSAHYTYTGDSSLTLNNGDFRLLAPVDLALGTEMGFKSNLNLSLPNMNTANGLNRNFECPSQATTDDDIKAWCWTWAGYWGNYYGGFVGSLSYVFNEGVLGFDDSKGRLRGKASEVRQPAKTFFACDGNGGSTLTRLSGTWTAFNVPASAPPQPWGSYTIWNNQTIVPVTLSDAYTKRRGGPTNLLLAGDQQNFDLIRHKGKMNVAFCDGHVEQRDIPNLTKDPQAVALMNIYILAQ